MKNKMKFTKKQSVLTIILVILLVGPVKLLQIVYKNLIIPFSIFLLVIFHEFILSFFMKHHLRRKTALLILILIEITTAISIIFIGLPLLFPYLYPFLESSLKSISIFLERLNLILNINIQSMISPYTLIDITLDLMDGIKQSIESIMVIYVITLFINFKYDTLYKCLSPSIIHFIESYSLSIKSYFKAFFLCFISQFLLSFTMLSIVNHPYSLMLSLCSAFSNIIPFIGNTLVSIMILIMYPDPSKLYIVLILLILMGFIDNYIITPKIYSYTSPLSNSIILFGMLFFHFLFGPSSFILLIPILLFIKEGILAMPSIKRFQE